MFQKKVLDIDFHLPRHHTSVISPEGFVLLLGGLRGEESIEFLNQSYILDFENETLVELTPMLNKRAGMASITTDFGILIVGGILDNFEVTSSCELYDIGEDNWTQISNMKEPVMNSSLCLWKGTKVIKFAGKFNEE